MKSKPFRITTKVSAPVKEPKQVRTFIPAYVRDELDLKSGNIIRWDVVENEGETCAIIRKNK